MVVWSLKLMEVAFKILQTQQMMKLATKLLREIVDA